MLVYSNHIKGGPRRQNLGKPIWKYCKIKKYKWQFVEHDVDKFMRGEILLYLKSRNFRG